MQRFAIIAALVWAVACVSGPCVRTADANEHGPRIFAAAPSSAISPAGTGQVDWLVVAQFSTDQPPKNHAATTTADTTYQYDARGRRDPFESLVKEKLRDGDLVPVGIIDPDRVRGPLERFDLSALKLVGILHGRLGRRGLIRAPDNKGYFVTIGMYMGQNAGQITAIEPDRLVIEEKFKDPEGNIVGKTLTLPLRRKKENG